MAAYALTVGKNGPKMTKTADALESATFSPGACWAREAPRWG